MNISVDDQIPLSLQHQIPQIKKLNIDSTDLFLLIETTHTYLIILLSCKAYRLARLKHTFLPTLFHLSKLNILFKP